MKIITFFYNLLWGDLIIVPLPGGSTLGLSLLVLILIPQESILPSGRKACLSVFSRK